MRVQSLQGSSELHGARADSLARQLADATRQLELAAAERAAAEGRLAAAQAAKPAIVPLSQACHGATCHEP